MTDKMTIYIGPSLLRGKYIIPAYIHAYLKKRLPQPFEKLNK